MDHWSYLKDGKQFGPVPFNSLVDMVANGALTETTLVWRPGLQSWLPASEVAGLFKPPGENLNGEVCYGAPSRPIAGTDRLREIKRYSFIFYICTLGAIILLSYQWYSFWDASSALIEYGYGNVPQERFRNLLRLSENENTFTYAMIGLWLTAAVFIYTTFYMMLNTLRMIGAPFSLSPLWSFGSIFIPLWNLYRPWAGLAEVQLTLSAIIRERAIPEKSTRGIHGPTFWLAIVLCIYAILNRFWANIEKTLVKNLDTKNVDLYVRTMEQYSGMLLFNLFMDVIFLTVVYAYVSGFMTRYKAALESSSFK